MNLLKVPGLISGDERNLLKTVVLRVAEEFEEVLTLVNIGIYMGASCYCMRAGAESARLFGVDINGWDKIDDTPDMRKTLNMTLIQGDSRKTHTQLCELVHVIFVDGDHRFRYVESDILNWVFPKVKFGGYVLFHDAYYSEGSTFYRTCEGVRKALTKHIEPKLDKEWEEQEKVDSIRWFKRMGS